MRCLGYYVNCDDATCMDCFQSLYGDDHVGRADSPGFVAWREGGGFEDWSEPIAIFRDSESDTPTHCGECGSLIPHGLTDHGGHYVEEAARQHIAAVGTGETPDPHSVRVVRAWLEEYGQHDVDGIVTAMHAALHEAMDLAGEFDEDSG